MEFISDPILTALRKTIQTDEEVYLVGGSVRDAILGRSSNDLDFACKNGIKLGRRFANENKFDFFILDKNFDTCRVIKTSEDGQKNHYDFAGYRKETLEQDLLDRDFSINSMAVDVVTGKLVDPTGGLKDIRDKVINLSSSNSLRSDPVRILRAIRFSLSLGFRFDPSVIDAIRFSVELLQNVSAERLRDEIFKIFEGPKPHIAFQLMDKFGILPNLFPELAATKGINQSAPHVNDVWIHTMNVIKHLKHILKLCTDPYDEGSANADLLNGMLVLKLGQYREKLRSHFSGDASVGRSKRSVLLFAALFHDVNKPQVKTVEGDGRIRFLGHESFSAVTAKKIGENFRLSGTELASIYTLVYNHMRIHAMVSRKAAGHELSAKTIYRFFRDCQGDGIALILLALADTRATYEHTLKQETWRDALDISADLLEAWYEKKNQVINPPALVNGDDLMHVLHLEPGPILGEVLETIRENQVMGKIVSKDEAISFTAKYVAQKKKDEQ